MTKQKYEKPTKQEIKYFLEVFGELCGFEAQHRLMRGWGLYKENDKRIKSVRKVLIWIKKVGKED